MNNFQFISCAVYDDINVRLSQRPKFNDKSFVGGMFFSDETHNYMYFSLFSLLPNFSFVFSLHIPHPQYTICLLCLHHLYQLVFVV